MYTEDDLIPLHRTVDFLTIFMSPPVRGRGLKQKKGAW